MDIDVKLQNATVGLPVKLPAGELAPREVILPNRCYYCNSRNGSRFASQRTQCEGSYALTQVLSLVEQLQ
jgi:hypothetical protein